MAFSRAGVVKEGERLGLTKGESVLVLADAVTDVFRAPCRVMIEVESGEVVTVAHAYIREIGDPLHTRQIVIAAEDGEVLAAIATDVSSNCTVLRVVAGTLQVRGPRSEEVKSALRAGRVAEVGELLDHLIEDFYDPDAVMLNSKLGGWISCRIAYS